MITNIIRTIIKLLDGEHILKLVHKKEERQQQKLHAHASGMYQQNQRLKCENDRMRNALHRIVQFERDMHQNLSDEKIASMSHNGTFVIAQTGLGQNQGRAHAKTAPHAIKTIVARHYSRWQTQATENHP